MSDLFAFRVSLHNMVGTVLADGSMCSKQSGEGELNVSR